MPSLPYSGCKALNTTKQMKDREQINFYEVVNHDKETGEIEMLDYVFEHAHPDKDIFKGATGKRFEPVSKEQYKDAMRKESIIERLEDCGMIKCSNEKAKRAALYSLYKQMKDNNELESFCFDLSYREHWDKLRALGYPEKKYPVFNCTGGGRMFTAPYKGNISEKLNEIINKYESR